MPPAFLGRANSSAGRDFNESRAEIDSFAVIANRDLWMRGDGPTPFSKAGLMGIDIVEPVPSRARKLRGDYYIPEAILPRFVALLRLHLTTALLLGITFCSG